MNSSVDPNSRPQSVLPAKLVERIAELRGDEFAARLLGAAQLRAISAELLEILRASDEGAERTDED